MANSKELSQAIIEKFLPSGMLREYNRVTNLDTAIVSGVYQVSISGATPENTPGFPRGAFGYGVLIVCAMPTFGAQLYISHQAGSGKKFFYFRVGYSSKGTRDYSWITWQVVDSVALT